MPERKYNVLFLCTGNSARSILAEAILSRDGKGRFKAHSAGSQPTGKVNPFAVKLLDRLHYETDGFRSKSWEEFDVKGAPQMDFIFTVCDSAANETCPVWPGKPVTAHWGVPDPAAAAGSEADIEDAFAETYFRLKDRIAQFVDLPLSELDRKDLCDALERIGHS